MADVTIKYNFRVPDEHYIEDFSGNKTAEFSYIGPDKLTVTMGANGGAYTQKLDGPVYDGEEQVIIDVVANPELLPIADLLWGRQYDHEATFDEVDLGDGHKYLEQNNRTIHDYYWNPIAKMNDDGTFKEWDLTDNVANLQMFTRDTQSPKQRIFIAKADMFIEIMDQYELASADATLLTNFKAAVETYRTKVSLPWKYPGVNPHDLTAPKIPMELITRHNEIKNTGLGNMMGSNPNRAPDTHVTHGDTEWSTGASSGGDPSLDPITQT